MKSFKQYLETAEPMIDFEDPSFNATYNAALKDKDRWPPIPKAKYDAQKRKWRVGKEGRKPEHLAKEQ